MGSILWTGGAGMMSTSGVIQINSYPNGDPLIHYLPPDKIERILLRPDSMHDLMSGLFLVDALQERGRATPSIWLPFVPGSRQDRLNDSGDYLFTAKSVAREINMRNFPRVTVVDPHSEVTPALIDRCCVIHPDEILGQADYDHRKIGYDVVIAPDAGASKRAGAVAKKLGVPVIHGWKSRDVTTGVITGFGLEKYPAPWKRGLLVDDICDGGGTFLGLANEFPEGVEVDLYVTHGLFTQGTEKLLSRYKTIYCTDSTVRNRPGVVVLPFCENQFKEIQ